MEPVEIFETDGKVVAVLQVSGRIKGSDQQVAMEEVHVMSLRDGMFSEVREYPTKSEASRPVRATTFANRFIRVAELSPWVAVRRVPLRIPPSARFCMACGAALSGAARPCGEPVPAGARFCMACGSPLTEDERRNGGPEAEHASAVRTSQLADASRLHHRRSMSAAR